jgi:hypothetical protein
VSVALNEVHQGLSNARRASVTQLVKGN